LDSVNSLTSLDSLDSVNSLDSVPNFGFNNTQFNDSWIPWIPQGFRIHGIQPRLLLSQ
jgi:hypothetical protein